MRWLRSTLLMLCAWAGVAVANTDEQVSFGDVLALPAREPDAVLKYGAQELQFGQLWLPDSPGPHPLIVFVHGGCWLNAYDVGHGAPLADALAGLGFAVWSLEYRRIGDAGGGWPGTFEDLGAGIDHVRALGRRYPIDGSRVILTGHSAGGHLVLWASARASLQPDNPLYAKNPLVPYATIGLGAITDLALYAEGSSSCERATLSLMGGGPERQAARYAAASPAQLVPWSTRTRLIHGRADVIVPGSQADSLASAASGADQPVEVVWVDGAGHFDLIHPGTRAFTVLLEHLHELAGVPLMPAG